ncbi:hypothetical protein [Mycolicibacterium hippocampi]|uniref:hypothetical protein n=1 Tax=Mycolicibacterium hippocampi TaxID=659824 RepID=UPI003513B839
MSIPGDWPAGANQIQVSLHPVHKEGPQFPVCHIVALAGEHVEVNDDKSLARDSAAQQRPVLDEIANTAGTFGLDENRHGRKLDTEIAELELLLHGKCPLVDSESVPGTLAGYTVNVEVCYCSSQVCKQLGFLG